MKGEAKGYLVAWAYLEEGYQSELRRWHNCEHMTERVTIPGFHVGRRFQGSRGHRIG